MHALAEQDPPIHDAKREVILRHARRAFTAEGYTGARIEPIARDAGVSTATIYALFDGKEELFAAVIEDSAIEFTRLMGHVRTTSGPARERLMCFATTYAAFMADPFIRAVFRLVMAERRRFQEVAMKFFDRGKADFGKVLIDALNEMVETGELRFERASWAAGQLMGMIEHPVFFMPLVTGDEVMPVRAVDQIANDAVETFLARYGV
ncbi:TetR/AcrR family transcriptional regulator [Brevundimonas sp. Root1423]|uniref:TetR/AcrR family transcriptional regulator n=1 Tax=Brevundimonas sp. Root1423 TaxID=1736462 RepID=UPI0006FB25F3|nr:TetR/AcrR family transcriptional regulator [Brevundimonas sp. Root1423]KQY96325.1 TetR family transcriptional regulator [Brevundimonas sp. Root1423]